MKYLKPFNEDITSLSFEEDLQEFCEMNLAYLLDEGGKIEINYTAGPNMELAYVIRINLDGRFLEEAKSWVEIKDHIIPFVTRLNNTYELFPTHVRVYFSNGSNTTFKVGDILNERIPQLYLNYKILDMSLYVTGYKKEPKKNLLTKIKSFFK